MPGSSSWIPYAPQGVKGPDDDDDDDMQYPRPTYPSARSTGRITRS